MDFEYVIVGAGLSGLTIAERIATQLDKDVLVIEKRGHIGGNCFDSYNSDGILIQNYGPHTFHTKNKAVYDYLRRFTAWRDYQHRVLSYVDGRFIPLPISLETINQLYNMNLNATEMEDFIKSRRIEIKEIVTSEDVCLANVGVDIYEKFFKHFTIKQWGVSPAELDKSVISRIPFRTDRDTRYFTDKYQGQPAHGYTRMFEKMCESPRIHMLLKTDYKKVIGSLQYKKLIFTGSLDYYFDYCYGKLKYRSIRLQFETHDMEAYQPVGSTRFPVDYDYTRITEFKELTGQIHPKTTILKEFPCDGKEPFYPFPTKEWMERAEKYRLLAEQEQNTYFIGGLAKYKYYNMDEVVVKALQLFETRIK